MSAKKFNHAWTRVTGPNLQLSHAERGKQNSNTFKSEVFVNACDAVGIKPTGRQASKFRRKLGRAFAAK